MKNCGKIVAKGWICCQLQKEMKKAQKEMKKSVFYFNLLTVE